MHPVSLRGRSMPRDRQASRGFLVVIGILCGSFSTGCLRSSVLRQDEGPVSRPAPASDAPPSNHAFSSRPGAPDVGGTGNSVLAPSGISASLPLGNPVATPPTELQPAPAPVQNQTALGPLPPQPVPSSPPAAAPVEETPADKPTPLLDAAIERVAAVTRQQRESLESAPPPSDPERQEAKPVASVSPAIVKPQTGRAAPTPSPSADTTTDVSSQAPEVIKVADTNAQSVSPTAPKDAARPIVINTEPKARAAVEADAVSPARETRGTLLDTETSVANFPAVADDVDALGIGKFCLCRKILGFGSFEPLHEPRVQVGKRILLYCEMSGMTYEARKGSFVSRLSSKIEIGSVQDNAFQWAHELGPAEDVCASRRRDFFVNYVFNLPQSLPPGSYRLRLTQTDLIANRSTSAEIPLEIVP
jgi:hypothetical protein